MVKNKKPLPTYECIEDKIFGCNSHKFTIRVTCDNITVCGIGTTKKVAKENAAKEILTILKIPSGSKETGTDNVDKTDEEIIIKKIDAISCTETENIKTSNGSEKMNNKSSVAELQELAAKNKKSLPIYECIEDKIVGNNSHEFTMRVTCDNITVCGTGSNKKVAKANAAKKLLTILKTPSDIMEVEVDNVDNNNEELLLGNLSTTSFSESESTSSSKDTKKTFKSSIAELQEIMTKHRKSLPTYDCIQNKIIGNNLHEFTIKVACDNVTVCGIGSNKKKAKENAAKEMLKLLKKPPSSKETETENIDHDAEYIIDILSKRSLVDLESTIISENPESQIEKNTENERSPTLEISTSSKDKDPEFIDSNNDEIMIDKMIVIPSSEWECITSSDDSDEQASSSISVPEESVMLHKISSKLNDCTEDKLVDSETLVQAETFDNCEEGTIVVELFTGLEITKPTDSNDSSDSEKRPKSPDNEIQAS
ncbi:interferon-inducible double-stranded RNA-dependent protein kinase activator A-like [Belonocnema kinseyi]|uniref:interferon-inducible double-stranded RNA-dependent protein kinase activator A-like n=1 Tax=Belonocnema kinseyi TaxID=2817044 RepID=UPI00143D0466|nr:interferon-inducible double-stranded RNA-dependent protein kinase activator A-like [Belonocnema kinseyi]